MSPDPDAPQTLLVVEDDEPVRRLVCLSLERAGFRAVEAENGAEGLDQLARHPETALIVLDWMMPVMDGIEMLRELADQPGSPPVIMLTAKTRREEIAEALEAGARDYVPKPLQKDQLLFKINNLLQRNRDRARTQAARRKPVHFRASLGFVIQDIDESGCSLVSSFPIPPDAVLVLQSDAVALQLDLARDHRFNLRVLDCEGKGNRYRLRAAFIGLPPALVQRIQDVTQKGGWSG